MPSTEIPWASLALASATLPFSVLMLALCPRAMPELLFDLLIDGLLISLGELIVLLHAHLLPPFEILLPQT